MNAPDVVEIYTEPERLGVRMPIWTSRSKGTTFRHCEPCSSGWAFRNPLASISLFDLAADNPMVIMRAIKRVTGDSHVGN
jgi:hypothetical protein